MSSAPKRFIALDIFRGLTIAMMILVNSPGNWDYVYTPLLHASWYGWTLTDLVFPFFLFIVGYASYFSLKKYQFTPSKATTLKLLKRTLFLFIIGYCLNLYNFLVLGLDAVRIMGVLQRIALCYFTATIMVLFLKEKQLYLAIFIILTGYWLLLLATGSNEPYSLSSNGIGAFDRVILGAHHMWQVHGTPFDPEGLLSTLPAIVNVTVGFIATRYLNESSHPDHAVARLIAWGVVSIGAGYILSVWLPISKNLWTSSYVLLSSGAALLTLGTLIWLTERLGNNTALRHLQMYGTNPILIYCLSWIVTATLAAIIIKDSEEQSVSLQIYLWQSLLPILDEKTASLVYALVNVGLFWILSKYFFKHKVFLKV